MYPIHVTSEINQLKKVLVHRPGAELLNLTPNALDELLFDDIPYLRQAQREHDAFAEIMRKEGVDVVYLEDLMAQTLDADPKVKEMFLHQFIDEGGVQTASYHNRLFDYFASIDDTKELIEKTMQGVHLREIKQASVHEELAELVGKRSILMLDPMPNLYFTRDPFVSIGGGVTINRMYSETRSRETIYAEYIFKYHPVYKKRQAQYYDRQSEFHIEGGDIFNLRKDVLAVGISQRTTPEAIQELAENLFYREESDIKRVIAINIPVSRAFMHLDTVFTQIDHDAFTYHPGIMDSLAAYTLTDEGGHVAVREFHDSLEEMLASFLELDKVRLFACANGDYIASQREQWNDGSNTLALAPGKILTYDRNEVTNAMLREAGFTVLEMPSYELSKGRGGPRCMTMPLERE